MTEKEIKKLRKLVNEQTYTDAAVRLDDGTEKDVTDVISSDSLVDIFFEIYPKTDELDARYDEMCNYVETEMHREIWPGECIIEGFFGKTDED